MKNLKNSGLQEDYLKLVDVSKELELISGAGWTGVAKSLVSCSLVSITLGNNGWVCTWTAECQSNCR